MPRELVHWEVLDVTLRELRERIFLKDPRRLQQLAAIESNLSYARLGALTPDAPYYDRFGRGDFAHVGESLHGAHGENTAQLLTHYYTAIAQSSDKQSYDAHCAFLLGYLSHIAVDVIFHPVVFYLTGNYYDEDPALRKKARGLHRLFETELEHAWAGRFCAATDNAYELTRYTIARSHSESAKYLPQIIAELDRVAPCENRSWRDALCYLRWLQRIFVVPHCGTVAQGINVLSGGKFCADVVLFNQRGTPEAFWSNAIHFANPVTNVSYAKTLVELRREAIELLISYVVQLPFFAQQQSPPLVTPSLNHGIPGVGNSELRHYGVVPEFLQKKWQRMC